MNPLKGIWLVVFAPKRFIREAADYAIGYESRTNTQLASTHPDKQLSEDRRLNIEATTRAQTDSIRKALFGGVGITLVTVAVGALAGYWLRSAFGVPPKIAVYFLQGVGASVILGATLGEVDRRIQTFDRTTLPEQVNAFLFRALYVLGTFLFVMSVAWDAT